MANVEQVQPRKGPSLAIQGAMLLVVTAAAIGMGWMSGGYLKGVGAPSSVPVAPENEGKVAQPAATQQPGTGPTLVTLAPITTNIASPADTWIRMEVSVVYDAPQPPAMAEDIQQDLLAFVRTLKMHQIEGASGYQHLKADLDERASIRSQGHVKQVLIRTLLLE
ncbi:flagellar basal body-associated FliL family protein [Mesorhizobium sp. M00.F.Ca.ET.151.01.1.1]|uniref:flagellar basal body-associated FliL family protein n=1 Tax=unclassified Mesorhizobium TaxID=325217 RepID=UPI000FCC7D3C|nr:MULTISPECIES: flagellar basal body-associated FliL family protein [unclassified Mesorhizobium]TGU96795.1 flagellar basal body-associated FliL family protein [Mesorhizobium sp. M00.F.Ca.ET.151.01.1.1]TGV57916.1 flagellar basal body-associated FliL family protein [bacterium M00.F.Ca.ET.141.01.1.1]RUW43545.1 flagellar basal body-associated FliL family protein [Mesorhizobium sp. M8A.F.Ca.ET.021.01.1.1]RWC89972.1 MAG: flagellar basal body-associated FliL family protein [Mesorhizobium sp.]TIT5046